MCFVYPVLQPVSTKRRGNGELPWSGGESRTFLKFSVFFANPFNRFGWLLYRVGGILLCFREKLKLSATVR